MCLDAGTVFKRYVLCPHCKEDYLFTLRAIAHNPELRCHGCGGSIRLSDRDEALLSDVRNTLDEIDSAPPSFISAHRRLARDFAARRARRRGCELAAKFSGH